MNIVCARDNDDPVEVMILIKRLDAEGVLAPPEVMLQLESMRHLITGQRQLTCRITGQLTEVDAFKRKEGVILHWLPPTIVIKGHRSKNISTTCTDATGKQIFEQKFADAEVVDVRVQLTDYSSNGKKSFTIVDVGVTGYESVWITKRFIDETCDYGWSACSGGMGWDRLWIPPDQMAKAHQELYTRVYQNQTD